MKKPTTRQHPVSPLAASLSVTRRRFLRCTTVASAGAALLGIPNLVDAKPPKPGEKPQPPKKPLPPPNKSGIEHIVVVMMENRSFDHLLGWLPGATGRQAGLSYLDSAGVAHPTYPLAPDYQGCGRSDPDHSYEGGRVEYNGGACDGWLRAGANDDFAIGYYTQNDLPFLGQAAPAWTTCDNYFAAILAETWPNRIYQHAAQTDRLDSSVLPLSTLPTIWDRLAEHSISRRYYYSDIPFLALWGTKYLGISSSIAEFYAACAAGTLPQVSFVEPRFFGEEEGITNDDHPHSDIRNGEVFLNSVYAAITSSRNWANTLLVINFDEWGGFFEHVPPTLAPIPPADAAVGNDGRRGFRVPALLISPWSPRQTVAHGLYDHTSVLKLIEWRYNLRALTVRDSSANNLAEVLDFAHPNIAAPAFAVLGGFFGLPCALAKNNGGEKEDLAAVAAGLGFPIY